MKSCLSSKTTDHSKKLVENDEVIDDTKVTKTLNSFFTEAVLNLKYQTLSIVMVENESNKDIDKIAEKYKHQSSVTALKQAFPDFSFSFKPVEREEFPSCLKQADITPVFIKDVRNSKNNYQMSQKYLKRPCSNKCQISVVVFALTLFRYSRWEGGQFFPCSLYKRRN